jgi:hypothetical protein
VAGAEPATDAGAEPVTGVDEAPDTGARPAAAARPASGSRMVKVEPDPTTLHTDTLPPWLVLAMRPRYGHSQ